MNVAIHGINFQSEFIPYIEHLVRLLSDRGAKIFYTESLLKSLSGNHFLMERGEFIGVKRRLDKMNYVFSVGGDGTLLDAVALVGKYETPIVGINTGRLGFLATVAKENITKAVSDLYSDNYSLETRSLVQLKTNKQLFGKVDFGLNEFTIHKRDTSSMIIVHTYINGQYLNSYWADGLIVATPTGSTGYSLSCGGPLITPDAKNFVITPVSPHNLNVRPIIVSDESEISFKIEGRAEKFLISLDSRSTAVDDSVELKVSKADFDAVLVKFSEYGYFDTLRQKLNWGFDMRN